MKIHHFTNGFGILKLDIEHTNTFEQNAIIYSSNGTFKSSFSHAFHHLSLGTGDTVTDRLNIDKTTNGFKCKIEIDGKIYGETDQIPNLIVYSRELNEDSNWMKEDTVNQLIVSKEYKKELEKINKSISSIRGYFDAQIKSNKLDTILQSNTEAMKFDDFTSLDDLIQNIEDLENLEEIDFPKEFDLKKLSQKAYAAIDTKDFESSAKSLVNYVEKEIKGRFFDKDFGIDGSLSIVKEFQKINFLNQYRKIVLIDRETSEEYIFDDHIKFAEFINLEIEKIIGSNPEIKKQKESLDKVIGNTVESGKIKENLKDLEWIKFYSNGRKNIIHSALKRILDKETILNHKNELIGQRKNVRALEKKVVGEKTDFETALNIHKLRFKPPFSISIENKMNTILNLSLPEFIIKPNKNLESKKDYNETRTILSTGERNAFDIINLIVKYETIANKKKAIVILDDIVESFDYGNRIAFIEYIKEMNDYGSKVIVLTHNFEFYRTLTKRLDKVFKQFSCYNTNGLITITKGTDLYFKNGSMFKISDRSNESHRNLTFEESFISSLPFVREVSEFTDTEEKYTDLFHIKEVSKNITVSQVINDIKSSFFKYEICDSAKSLLTLDKNYYDFVIETCENVSKKQIGNFDIYRKIILAIGCRIKVEKLMINDDYTLLHDITKDQTRKLYKKIGLGLTEEFSGIVERVLLCTSEFIHLNAFLYEPLVDIPPSELVMLFKDLSDSKLKVFK